MFFDRMFNEDLYSLPRIFADGPGLAICVTGAASEKPFMALATMSVPDHHLVGAGSTTQVIPFLGPQGRDNVTARSAAHLRAWHHDDSSAKVDIFRYVY